MAIIVTLKTDKGSIGESSLSLDCVRVEQDPIFDGRVLLILAKPLTLNMSGTPMATKRWSVDKADVLSWYEVDRDTLDKIAKQASEASLSLSKAKQDETPTKEPEKAQGTYSDPVRVEVLKPEVELSVTTPKGQINLSLDLDDEDDEQ